MAGVITADAAGMEGVMAGAAKVVVGVGAALLGGITSGMVGVMVRRSGEMPGLTHASGDGSSGGCSSGFGCGWLGVGVGSFGSSVAKAHAAPSCPSLVW